MTWLLLAALLVVAQDSPPERCRVSGTVVNAATGDPLGGVEVLLEPAGRQTGHTAATLSDSKGRFSLVELAPGSYHLKGQRNGFLVTYLGARRLEVAGPALRLEEGQALQDLKLKLVAPGVIAGTVFTSEGEPLVDASVEIARLSYEGGRRHIEGFDSTSTNDLGQYRFFRLHPGTYYVSARARFGEWKVDHSAEKQKAAEVSVPTFYPGVRESAAAAPIRVATGARATGIDITLLRTAGYRVSGRVVGAVKAAAMSVTLSSRSGASGESDLEYRTYTQNAAGDFEFRGVPSGPYVLSASGWPEGAGWGVVEVAGGDVEGLRLALTPFVEIRGRITAEGEGDVKPAVREVFLTEDGRSGQAGPVAEDGTFTVRNLLPGRRIVRMLGGSYQNQFYLESIRSGDADVLESGLEVTEAGAPPLMIVFSSDGGALEGRVLDEDSRATEGATVVLVPHPSRRAREDLFKKGLTDRSGRYQFTAVAPGDYSLLAWNEVEEDAWLDPEFLKEYEDEGMPVAIRPKGRQTQDLRLIPDRKP